MPMRVKICGLMRPEDVAMCCRVGVDICGFVTEYPLEVPWNLTRDQCASLMQSVAAPAKSCIVTGGSPEKIVALARALRPDLVQLHYRETLEDTRTIVQALSPHGTGVIKTIPNSAGERLQQFGTDDAALCARALDRAGVWAVLVDSRGPGNAASAGVLGDLALFRRVQSEVSCPVMLGGGIRADNCRQVMGAVNPAILDIMTGVELAPGVKSEGQIKQVLACVRACQEDPARL